MSKSVTSQKQEQSHGRSRTEKTGRRDVDVSTQQQAAPICEDPEPPMGIIQALIGARSGRDAYRLIMAHLELLTDEVIALLDSLADSLRQPGDDAKSTVFEQIREVLKRCREIGVKETFAELSGMTVEEIEAAERSPRFDLPDDLQMEIDATYEAEARYRGSRDTALLDSAVASWNRVLAHRAFDEAALPVRLELLDDAGQLMGQKYMVTSAPEDLERWLAVCERTVANTPADSDNRAPFLSNLGEALRCRWMQDRRIEDLEAAVAVLDEAVAHAPADSTDRPMFVGNLGRILFLRYQETQQHEDVEKAIEAFREAQRGIPEDSLHRVGCLLFLGAALRARFEWSRKMADLDQAVDTFVQAVSAALPDDRGGRAQAELQLCRMLIHQLTEARTAGEFHRIVRSHRELLDDQTMAVLVELRDAALEDNDQSGADMFESYRLLLQWCREIGVDRAFTDKLGYTLDDLEALDAAARQQVECLDPLKAARSEGGLQLTADNHDRFLEKLQWEARLHDLLPEPAEQPEDESVDPLAELASDTKMMVLNNTGKALYRRFEQNEQMEDLDAAIEAFRQMVAATPSDSPAWPKNLTTLAVASRDRYDLLGRMEDLETAGKAYSDALDASSPTSPELPARLNGLANCVYEYCGQAENIDGLDMAIELYRQAVEATPSDSSDLPQYLSNLANGLQTRYQFGGKVEDLEEAIEASRKAIATTPADSSALPGSLNNMGIGLLLRSKQRKDNQDLRAARDDLEEAVELFAKAVEITPLESQYRPRFLLNLGRVHGEIGEQSDDSSHLTRAQQAYTEAIDRGMENNLALAFAAARTWADQAFGREDWREAFKAYSRGFEASDGLYQAQLLRDSKESLLRQSRGMRARAAYCQVRMGELSKAVLTLETGRARLLTELLERDMGDLEGARAKNPDACARYEDACEMLQYFRSMEHAEGSSEAMRITVCEFMADERAKMQEALQEIRLIEGYERFLLPPEPEDLAEQLEADIPVLYLFATSAGGFALAVCKRDGEMMFQSLPLDRLTEPALVELLVSPGEEESDGGWLGAYHNYLDASEHHQERENDPAAKEAFESAREFWHRTIEQTTRRLWDLVMGPTVDFLHSLCGPTSGESKTQQVTLIPCGLLGLFPLHAAWTEKPTKRWAMDDIAFRYAPSLRAMARARSTAEQFASEGAKLLTVDEPTLSFSEHEVNAAAEFFDEHKPLHGAERQPIAVRSAIRWADVCHFACHGYNDMNPLQSALSMADGELLTVESILAMLTQKARLAVLSACETGIVDARHPDEVVAMPAAFMQAGFAGVVASLWRVDDASTAMLMARFYELWRAEQLPPAVALQRAQIWLRDTSNKEKFLHFADSSSKLPEGTRTLFCDWFFKVEGSAMNAHKYRDPVWWAAFHFTGV